MPFLSNRSMTGPKALRSSASGTWVNDSQTPPDGEPRPASTSRQIAYVARSRVAVYAPSSSPP